MRPRPMMSVHRETVGAATCRAGDPLTLETVLTGDAVTLTRSLVIIILDRAHIVLNVSPDSALSLYHLIHQDLLHLSVIEVVQLPHGVLSPCDQIQEDCPGRDPGHELVLTQPL